MCVFPNGLCSDVPVRECDESKRRVCFRTASGEKVLHEGIKTIECSTEHGLNRRITCAVTSVREILLAASRLTETGHRVHFTKTGGYIKNDEDVKARK